MRLSGHRELVREVGTLGVCHVVPHKVLQHNGHALSPHLQAMHSPVRVLPTGLQPGMPEHPEVEVTGDLHVVVWSAGTPLPSMVSRSRRGRLANRRTSIAFARLPASQRSV